MAQIVTELSCGFTLGPFEVLSLLGRGGVVEVWRQFWKDLAPADPTGVDSLAVDSLSRVIVTRDGKPYAYSFVRDLLQLFIVSGIE